VECKARKDVEYFSFPAAAHLGSVAPFPIASEIGNFGPGHEVRLSSVLAGLTFGEIKSLKFQGGFSTTQSVDDEQPTYKAGGAIFDYIIATRSKEWSKTYAEDEALDECFRIVGYADRLQSDIDKDPRGAYDGGPSTSLGMTKRTRETFAVVGRREVMVGLDTEHPAAVDDGNAEVGL